MGNPAFNVVVVLFWLATMSWLFVAKVLPPLRVGEPPSYTTIADESKHEEPACWAIRMQGRTVGWAANRMLRRPEGISEFYSRVYLGELPLDELAPNWLTAVLKPVLPDLQLVDVDKAELVHRRPAGTVVRFRLSRATRRHTGCDPRARDGRRLEAQAARSLWGHFSHALPAANSNSLMSDELSPQARMPNLRLGQTWTVPLYSPFRSPESPMEILQAVVEREDPMIWHGQPVQTKIVVYRGDSGGGRGSETTRGRMWVREDGIVLRQEVSVFKSPIQFERIPDAQAVTLRESLPADWRYALPAGLGKKLLNQLRAEAAPAAPEEASKTAAATETPAEAAPSVPQ